MTTILNGGQPVTDETDLNTAIKAAAAAAANSGAYEIDIGQNITLTTALEAINLKTGVTLDIEGGNYALDGNHNTERGLFVYAGTVTIDSLTIQNAAAIGGGGGGGGLGAGGDIFVQQGGSLVIQGGWWSSARNGEPL
jgi:hypothetical protein